MPGAPDSMPWPGRRTLSFAIRVLPTINYWDGVEALFGYRNGVTYIRFRNGDNPAAKNIRSSPGPRTEYSAPAEREPCIYNKSNIKIKGFWIRAARNAVLIYGASARNNIIEENYLTNGNTRVFLYDGASSNHIRNNEMKMNGLGNFKPGAGDDSLCGLDYISSLSREQVSGRSHHGRRSQYPNFGPFE